MMGAALFCVNIHAHTAAGLCPPVPVPEEFSLSAGVPLPDTWLYSPNAAALTRYALADMGTAELSLTKAKGGFTDFSGSPDALSVDASVASYFRLGSRAVVYGSMSYTNFSGHDMAGSTFIPSFSPSRSPQPATVALPSRHLPFDIVEDSLTNTGTKHQDTYRLCGGVGYDLCRGFSLGVRMAYTAANMAKYKDLRHKNKLMDLDLTAGVYLPLTLGKAQTAVGASYLYHRTTESLRFSTYGKSDKVYNSLIAYANFTGHVEQFGSDGYTDKSREMPLVSDYNGVGIQFSVAKCHSHLSPLTPHLFFFNSFTYAHRRGYYGRQSPYTITYTGHASHIYQYEARLSASTGRGAMFALDLSLSAENLRNDASNYRELQNEQGATYYEYYSPVKNSNKLWTDGTVAFTACLGTVAVQSIPKWSLRVGLNWHRREQTAYVYPFYRRQELHSLEPFMSIGHNRAVARSSTAPVWSLALDFAFLNGRGEPFEDLTFQQPSDKQELPPSMDACLWREYEWLTSAQYYVGGTVKYSFVMPATRLRTYARLSLAHRKANECGEYSNGRDRTTATVAIGCDF